MTMTPDEMRAHLEAAPLPHDGPPIHERNLPTGLETGGGYDMAARSAGHAFLVLCEEDPTLLDVPTEDPGGVEATANTRLWQAFQDRWFHGDEWLGGITGFQYGWAHNAVRYVLGRREVGNPAIIEIRGAREIGPSA